MRKCTQAKIHRHNFNGVNALENPIHFNKFECLIYPVYGQIVTAGHCFTVYKLLISCTFRKWRAREST